MRPFEVTVHCLPATAADGAVRAALTDAEEQQRARFYHRADAERFVVGRGTLRCELARRLGVAPREVPLVAGAHGKLHVAGGIPHVNVAHSGDVVLVALAAGAPLGVDVERVDARLARETVLETCFSAREIGALAALPPAMHTAAFFHVWTSREAVMKAVGLGFSLPREDFDVAVDPREPPRLVAARSAALTGAPLTLRAIPVADGHVAALAVAADAAKFEVTVVGAPRRDAARLSCSP